jgi:alkyldihydroxyacetonephosphate synthase
MSERILEGTLASIIKWGRLDHHYRVPDRLFPMLEQLLKLDLSMEFENLADLREISFPIPKSRLEENHIAKIKEIVGKEHITTETYDRVRCAAGYSYYDVIRLRLGKLAHYPDAVVYPDNHDEVQAILSFANENKIPVVPLGGRTGVTEASEPTQGGIVLDLTRRMNKILELDEKSLTVRCQAGILLPDLEAYLNEKGFLLGHFPQSFEHSSLGGSIVTRGAGQQSTKYGKIEDMVFGLRLATPVGEKRTVELPASAMGPDLIRVVCGSEGTLGVVTDVLMKVHSYIPETRDFSTFLFKDFSSGLGAIREIMQYGVTPATVRLSDPEETWILTQLETTTKKKPSFIKKALEGVIKRYLKRKGYMESACLLILEYEGEKEIVRLTRSKSHQISKKWKGFSIGKRAAKEWYRNRFELPYLRDNLMDIGVLVDTLETAAPWSRIESLYDAATGILQKHADIVMTHCSHCYREGASLYFTYLAKRKIGQEAQQILDIQHDFLTVLDDEKCALSHHHGIGRAFKKWFVKHSEAEVIVALKKLWDPYNVMNPGNLVDI